MIQDFCSAAFPWIVCGVALAVTLTYYNEKDKNAESNDSKNN